MARTLSPLRLFCHQVIVAVVVAVLAAIFTFACRPSVRSPCSMDTTIKMIVFLYNSTLYGFVKLYLHLVDALAQPQSWAAIVLWGGMCVER